MKSPSIGCSISHVCDKYRTGKGAARMTDHINCICWGPGNRVHVIKVGIASKTAGKWLN